MKTRLIVSVCILMFYMLGFTGCSEVLLGDNKRIEVSSEALSYNLIASQTQSDTLDVNSGSTRQVERLFTTIIYAEGQPEGWLSAELNQSRTPAEIVIDARSNGLAPGSYTAELRVSSNDAVNSPVKIEVTLDVAIP